MGRYIEWDDVIDRYPSLDTIGGADQLSSSYIVYAEAAVDGLLASHFTPPFSNNNMTVRDLSIEYVYWRAGRFKVEDAAEVKSSFYETINMLKSRQMVMFDSSGSEISGVEVAPGTYSSTQSYATSFGIDDPLNWEVDPDRIDDVQDSRD